jgi:hypothetical protein
MCAVKSHRFFSLYRISIVAAVVCLKSMAADPEDRAGGRALPGGHRTLADLIEEAERDTAGAKPSGQPSAKSLPQGVPDPKNWKWEPDHKLQPEGAGEPPAPGPRQGVGERPQAIQAPLAVPQANIARLQQLIDQRNRIVDACDFFETLQQIAREEVQLRQCGVAAVQAQVALNQANVHLNNLMVPGANLVAAKAKADARRAVDQARRQVGRAEAAFVRQQEILQPLYGRVAPHLVPWVKVYRDMAEFLVPRRSDPNRQAVLATIEGAIGQRQDFFEGQVLAAFGHAYDGQAKPCTDHLKGAIAFIDGCAPVLYTAHVTHDCAYACVIADQGELVKGFVKAIEGLAPRNQSAYQQWLVATHAVSMKRTATAGTYFLRALAKVDGFAQPKAGGQAAPIDPILAGDATHFFLTKQREVDLEKYSRLIDRVAPGGDAWQLARAQAALAARRGNWPKALRAIKACKDDCPETLVPEVTAEETAYQGKTIWIRGG